MKDTPLQRQKNKKSFAIKETMRLSFRSINHRYQLSKSYPPITATANQITMPSFVCNKRPLFLALLFLMARKNCRAFSPTAHGLIASRQTSTALQMAWLDNLFNPKMFPEDAQVTARHILCKKRNEAEEVKKKFNKLNFAKLAKEYSTCPSGEKGGNLGSFKPGQMAPDFDEAVFDPEVSTVGELTGPVMTPVRSCWCDDV